MNNKYYTPEIDEFHIGFQYEFNHGEEWFKHAMSWDTHPNFEDYEKYKQYFRVKRLDSADIESELKKFNLTIVEFEEDSVYEADFNKAGICYRVFYTYADKMIIFYERETFGFSCFFKGTIKNISEFRKALEQLGIK